MGEENHKDKFKSKSKKTLDRLANKISFAQIDELDGKKYLHYCTFYTHPGTIGLNMLYKKDCLNGCKYYKRFILENQQNEAYNQFYDSLLKTKEKPLEDNRQTKPRKPRKDKHKSL